MYQEMKYITNSSPSILCDKRNCKREYDSLQNISSQINSIQQTWDWYVIVHQVVVSFNMQGKQ